MDPVSFELTYPNFEGTCPSSHWQAQAIAPSRKLSWQYEKVDETAMKKFFEKYDVDSSGEITFDEFVDMTLELGIAPLKKEGTALKEKRAEIKAWRSPGGCAWSSASSFLLRHGGQEGSSQEGSSRAAPS